MVATTRNGREQRQHYSRQINARQIEIRSEWSDSERRMRSLQAASAIQALWTLIACPEEATEETD